MAADILKLKREYEVLRSDRSQEETVWDEIEKYIMPLTGTVAQAILGAKTDATTSIQLWDLTAPLAAEHLASALHGDITSPSTKWLDLEWQDSDLEQDHDAVKYREQLAEIAWGELQASDFGMEIASAYLEWGTKGNMCLVAEPTTSGPKWKGFDFTGVPIAQTCFVEDSRGGVLRWYRHLRWTAVQIVDHCESSDPPCPVPERIRALAEKTDGATTKLDVIFCIFRRGEIEEDLQGEAIQEQRPWGCVHFLLNEGEQFGMEGGYYRMPVVMGRFTKRPGSCWGTGRGHIALRSVKYLNAMKEMQRLQAELAIDPALGVTERVGEDINLQAGKATVFPSKDDVWSIRSESRFDVSAEVLQDERLEIRRAFHEDDLQLKESPQMTATEVQARKDQMNRALGSPVARLQTDVLEPIVQIVLDHLARAGRLPPPPEIVKAKQGRTELKLRCRGPIARAQLMDEVVSIERSAAFIANLIQLGLTEARHYLNLGGTLKEHAKRLGTPMACFNSDIEAKKLIQAERQAIAQAQAAKTAKDSGQAMQAAASGAATAAGIGVPIGEQPALLPSGGVAA